MNTHRTILLSILLVAILGFFLADGQHYLTIDQLKNQQNQLSDYVDHHPFKAVFIYGLTYIVVTGLSLPGATILTLAGGAIFGLFWGTLLVSFASTLGATLAFLAARLLFKDLIQSKFKEGLQAINAGIAKEGAFYLFALRLVPIFPFFVINLAMGLTPITTRTFYWVSQIGMLAGTLVYVNAGTQLSKLDSLQGILSPGLLVSFIILGAFPLIAKQIIARIKAHKVYTGWTKPAQFENNIIVIGAGAGGLVASYIAAALKAKVTLIEKDRMGGECLNSGCVPSKALIRSAKFLSQMAHSKQFGINSAQVDFEFAEIMERVQTVISKIAPHDSTERYTALGVEVINGTARITSPWHVEIETTTGHRTLTTRSIIIAAGAHPFIPAITGLDAIKYFTSDTIWNIRILPKRLLILGGGPIGCELAQAFARFGSQITLLERSERLMSREDPDISALILEKFQEEGIRVLLGHQAKQFLIEQGEKMLLAENLGAEIRINFDEVLLTIGRSANLHGFGVEELGIAVSSQQALSVNEFQETNYPNIYACGDITGLYQFTHTAAHQAWHATINALFGTIKKFRVDYTVVPWATFTDPEVARVGLNEQEAQQHGIAYEVNCFEFNDLDRAITDETTQGFVKVLTAPGKDRILGVTIVGERSGEMITEFVLAMRHQLGLNKILSTIHIYPTLTEANKAVAGNWKRQHVPEWLLVWLAHFHTWQRH